LSEQIIELVKILRLGASLDLRFGYDTLEFMEYLHKIGLNHIEVRRDNEYVHGQVGPDLMREKLKEYGFTLSYHAPCRDFNLASVNEDIRQSCVKQIIDIGRYLDEVGTGWVNIHVGQTTRAYHDSVIDKAKNNCLHSLFEIADAFMDFKTKIYVENDNYEKNVIKFGLQPHELQDIFEMFPEFSMTYDVGHANLLDIDPICFTRPLHNTIHSIHLHDNHGIYDEHLCPGEGMICYEKMLNYLNLNSLTFIFEMKKLDDIPRARDHLLSLQMFEEKMCKPMSISLS
jgi:sugar phosphate isomerase/epimerase